MKGGRTTPIGVGGGWSGVVEASPWPLGVVRPPPRARSKNIYIVWPSATPGPMGWSGHPMGPDLKKKLKKNVWPLGVAEATPNPNWGGPATPFGWPATLYIFINIYFIFLLIFLVI
jgi:hypothetical protein